MKGLKPHRSAHSLSHSLSLTLMLVSFLAPLLQQHVTRPQLCVHTCMHSQKGMMSLKALRKFTMGKDWGAVQRTEVSTDKNDYLGSGSPSVFLLGGICGKSESWICKEIRIHRQVCGPRDGRYMQHCNLLDLGGVGPGLCRQDKVTTVRLQKEIAVNSSFFGTF